MCKVRIFPESGIKKKLLDDGVLIVYNGRRSFMTNVNASCTFRLCRSLLASFLVAFVDRSRYEKKREYESDNRERKRQCFRDSGAIGACRSWHY